MRTIAFLLASLPCLAATACTGVDGDGDGGAAVLTDPRSSASFDVVSRSAVDEGADLLAALPTARLTLEAGIAQASSDGFPISGKFEMADDGSGISLSVYTARGGRDTLPEMNQLAELAGSPTGATWSPSAEVFADYEHIARASQHLTLMALNPAVTLDQVIRAASAEGTVYRVEPIVTGGRAAFDVKVATATGAEELQVAQR